MKSILLLVIASFLLSLSSAAQDTALHVNYYLTALRNEHHSFYKPGTRLAIAYNDGTSKRIIKGVFKGEKNDEMVIADKGGKKNQTYIPVDQITAARRIHPRSRIAFGIIGTALVTGGAIILNDSGNSVRSTYQAILAIPFIGLGSYLVVAVPISLLADQLTKKKRQNGWKFQLSEH